MITDAKKQALTTCWHARVLTLSRGHWRGSYLNPPVNGTTVADLCRDGLLVRYDDRVSGLGSAARHSRAYLTPKGARIAERLAREGEPLRYAAE